MRIALLALLNLASFVACHGQTEWDVPWMNVGDSSALVPGKTVHLTGIVTYGPNREALPGATISLDDLKHFDVTDRNGAYYMDIPVGTYRMRVRHVGLLPVYKRLRVLASGTVDVNMNEGVVELTEILITSRPIDSNVRETLSGLTKLNIAEIKTLPTLMGEVDIMKSLQLMPGVTSVGEGSSGLNVRGGRTDQNLALLNGVPLFNSSHALGFVSGFNQDVIQDFSLYKGNVPANYGGRASSVLEITTRRGDFEKWVFQGGAGPITSRFTVEGPLKEKVTSLIAAGRVSHANWVLRRTRNPDVRQSRAGFFDGYAGVAHRFTENSSADLTVYSSGDHFQFSSQFGYDWSQTLITGKWQALANREVSPSLSLAYGRFGTTLFDPSGIDARQISNRLDYFQLQETAEYLPDDDHEVRAGIAAVAYVPRPEEQRSYNGNPSIIRKSVERNRGLEMAVFLNDDYKFSEKLSISLGVRYSHYLHFGPDTIFAYTAGVAKTVSSISDTLYFENFSAIRAFGGIEPRVAARYGISPNQSVKISYNRMRQYIHQISNTTAPTPIDVWQVSNSYFAPQVTDNVSVGYFHNLKDNRWETSVELFGKIMRNVFEYKDFPDLFLNTHLETELLAGDGLAYGGELYLRRLKGRWTGWLSYTYSHTEVKVASDISAESINAGEAFPANYNKPHNLNIVLNRTLRRGSAFSFIFSYATGRPYTAIESSYVSDDIVVPLYSPRNKYKIPDYFRLDFSITAGNVSPRLDDSLVFALYNVFGRENAYSIFYKRPQNNFLVPKPYKLAILGAIMPSLTYNFKF